MADGGQEEGSWQERGHAEVRAQMANGDEDTFGGESEAGSEDGSGGGGNAGVGDGGQGGTRDGAKGVC